MSQEIPPAIDGVEQRLDAIYGRLGELLDRLPAAQEPPRPPSGQVEFREPAAPAVQEEPAAPAVRKPAQRRTPAKKPGRSPGG